MVDHGHAGRGVGAWRDPEIVTPQLVPLVQDLTVTEGGLTPEIAWTLPDLTGYDVENVRVRIYDDATNNMIFASSAMAPTTSEYTIPASILLAGGQYVFAWNWRTWKRGARRTVPAPLPRPTRHIRISMPLLFCSMGRPTDGGDGVHEKCFSSLQFQPGRREAATLVLTGLGEGDFSFTLENGAGTVFAIGAGGAENVDESIRQFVAPDPGTYFVRIVGPPLSHTVSWSHEGRTSNWLRAILGRSTGHLPDGKVLGAAGNTGSIGGGGGGSVSLGIDIGDGTGYHWDIQGDGSIGDGDYDAMTAAWIIRAFLHSPLHRPRTEAGRSSSARDDRRRAGQPKDLCARRPGLRAIPGDRHQYRLGCGQLHSAHLYEPRFGRQRVFCDDFQR